MLKGGVIMDVVNAEQARVAQDAGAVSVMALSGCRRYTGRRGCRPDGRPTKILEIMDAVSIPVMAKCRIGHFVRRRCSRLWGWTT